MEATVKCCLILGVIAIGCSCRLVDPVCLQGPTSAVNAMACCRIPEFVDTRISERCAANIMENKDSPMDMAYGMTQEDVLFSPGIRCISECILNDTTLLVDNEIRIEPGASTMAAKFLGDKAWLPVMQQAMETCNTVVRQTTFKKMPSDECSFKSAFFMACLDTKIFENCPAPHWKDEYGCAKLKQDTSNCPVLSAVLIRND